MKLIYIAGKYTGKTYSEIDDNMKKAESVAIRLVSKIGKYGFYPVTPHLNTGHFEIYEPAMEGIDYNYWLRGTMDILSRCDGILMMNNWQDSSGAKQEHEFAKQRNIPIYYSIDEINYL